MKYFITGAAGSVRSRLVKSLLAQGQSVVGFDNLNDYYPVINKEINLKDLTESPRFTFVKGDLKDEKLTRDSV